MPEIDDAERLVRLQAIADTMWRPGLSDAERDALRAEWSAISSQIDVHLLNERLGPDLTTLLEFHYGPERVLN